MNFGQPPHEFALSVGWRHFDLVADTYDESPVSVLAADLERIGIAQLGGLGIWTARDGSIPVTVQLLDAAPADDLTLWDRVSEGSIELGTTLIVRGLTDPQQAPAVPTTPGTYRVRVYWSGLDTLDEHELDGDDHYRIVLWPDVDPLEDSRELKAFTALT